MSPLRASDLPPEIQKRLGLKAKGPSKFNAVAIVVDGERFGSLHEARRYQELVFRLKAGEIDNLQLHPSYLITRDGVALGRYTADFRYWSRALREWVVEDAKGGAATKTEAYRLRKTLVEHQYGIEIKEV